MDWTIDRKRPIAPQICEQLCVQISAGNYPAGCRLPSVRDIAVSAGVNPNTVQKALELLSERGVVYPERGSGWYVSSVSDNATEIKDGVIREKTLQYFEVMRALGLDTDAVKQYIKEWME